MELQFLQNLAIVKQKFLKSLIFLKILHFLYSLNDLTIKQTLFQKLFYGILNN